MIVNGTISNNLVGRWDSTFDRSTQTSHHFSLVKMHDHTQTAVAIKTMITRGAGAIGATGAAGMAQAALEAPEESFAEYIEQAAQTLANTRPTAQNLFYGINTVRRAIDNSKSVPEARIAAVNAAQFVADEDVAACQKIGEYGNSLIQDGWKISTHCNAGWLAFVDWGSALSPIYTASRAGKNVSFL